MVFQVTSFMWDELSLCYCDSPYFTIDTDVLKMLPASQISVTRSDTDDVLATADSRTATTAMEHTVDDEHAAEH